MQCAYALLMVLNKTLLLYPDSNGRGPMVETLIVQLQAGLESISRTLGNYATAFEALGGMRGAYFSSLVLRCLPADRTNRPNPECDGAFGRLHLTWLVIMNFPSCTIRWIAICGTPDL
jgi:hypothetical protein